jgi:hypothetical protein
MAARPHASVLTGGLECIWPDADDRCYTELERSNERSAPTVGPWAWPQGVDFTVVGLCMSLSIFSRAGQFGMELERANARETRKRPLIEAVALSDASCSTEEERSSGAIAMHSNVPGYRRAQANPRTWRHVRARPRTPGG